MLTYLGQVHGMQEPLDLSEVCRRLLPILQTNVLNQVPVGAHLSSPGPAITANTSEIQQVLSNLLINAREALREASRPIDLTVKTVTLADIPSNHRFPVGWEPHNAAYACLEVADTGCGITRADIENLFDPFFSSKFAGRGLGLPVVLGIARAHDGVVKVESEPGRGSVFRVFFPITAVTPPEPPASTKPASRIQHSGAALLVDDEPVLRQLAATVIRDLGFDVVEAQDGIEAVELFQMNQSQIRFVVCDLTMPRMDGWGDVECLAPEIARPSRDFIQRVR